jgi:hypothetical protein
MPAFHFPLTFLMVFLIQAAPTARAAFLATRLTFGRPVARAAFLATRLTFGSKVFLRLILFFMIPALAPNRWAHP